MRFLVTGGTGFVGRVLVSKLVAQFGAESVTCLINPVDSEFERKGQAVLRNFGVRMISADIRALEPNEEEIDSFDVLIHLAATTDSQSLEHSTNDRGTENLLRALGNNLNGARVVYASTTAVYDPKDRTQRAHDESSPCNPRTEYGRTKLRGEEIVKALQPSFGYSYVILRLSTVYGQNVRPDGFFTMFGNWVRRGHFICRIPWPGKLGIVHIDDVARIFLFFSQSAVVHDDTFCVATESPSIVEISSGMARALGVSYEPFAVPGIVWTMIRFALRIPGLLQVLPWTVAGKLWRLGHMVDHGFWCDGGKLAQHYREPLMTLDEGIGSIFADGEFESAGIVRVGREAP